MAPIPANLGVDFTSQYADNRVGYRILGAVPYTVINNIGGGVGVPVHYDIVIAVDHETCDPVTYEVYVQSMCQAEASLDGRVSSTVTFTPVNVCIAHYLRCNSTGVLSITVTDPGTGYNPAALPVVQILGGGGSLATAVAVVGDDGVLTYTLTNAGAGMTDGTYAAEPAVGGTGAGATFDVTVVGNIITALTLVDPGTGYTVADTVDFPGIVGSGTEVVTIDTLDTGFILDITVTAAGSGYTSIPVVSIDSPPAGNQAYAEAVMEPCAVFTVTECTGGTSINIQLELDQEALVCTTDDPWSPPSGYTDAKAGCCYDCRDVVFTNNDCMDVDITYIDCATGVVTVDTVLAGNVLGPLCMVNESWYYAPVPDPLLFIATVGSSSCYP